MHWNHRVVKRIWYPGTELEEVTYAIHEAYYDENNNVTSITENPVDVRGEDIDGLKWVLEKMGKCLEHPIINYEDLVNINENEDGWAAGPGSPSDVDPSL